jgi:VCBS repeat-containing protein
MRGWVATDFGRRQRTACFETAEGDAELRLGAKQTPSFASGSSREQTVCFGIWQRLVLDILSGGSGDDLINAGAGADRVTGGSGHDTLNGEAGDDHLDGGSGNDVLDGGSGSDEVSGGSGSDTLIYVASENQGSTDRYDGGTGKDKLRLVLTRAEWMNPSLQADLAAYLDFIRRVSLPTGEARNETFRFSAFDLRVSRIENVEVVVDGFTIDPRDDQVILASDALTVGEDGGPDSINVLANDTVLDLVRQIAFTKPGHGTVTLQPTLGGPKAAPSALFTYTPDSGYWQYLAAGQTATDTFTYTITDADRDSSTATVTVTIQGANDAPIITSMAQTGAITELEGRWRRRLALRVRDDHVQRCRPQRSACRSRNEWRRDKPDACYRSHVDGYALQSS